MRPPGTAAHAGGMDLLFVPLFVAFVVFVVYGGLVLPAREIADSVRSRRASRGARRREA